MPHRLQGAADAPDGMTIQIRRHRINGWYTRVWRVGYDDVVAADAPDRRDFVLIHGIGASSQYFESLAVYLASIGNVYMFDLPGFDGVPQPSRALTIADFAELVGRWTEQGPAINPVFIGHSMGAQVVVELLAGRPELSSDAVLIGPPVNDYERSTAIQGMRLLQSSVFESATTRRIVLRGYARCGMAWFLRVLPEMMHYPISRRIGELRARVLLVRGTRDSVAPHYWLEHLAGLCLDARVVEIDGAAHGVVPNFSQDLAEVVLAQLRD